MKSELLCIKLGGSVITDKKSPYTAQRETIRSIIKILRKSKLPLFISHGVGSFAHTSAKKYGGKNGYKSKWGIAKVSFDATAINSIVMEILLEEKLPVISFSPRSLFLTKNGKTQNFFFDPINEVLKQGLIPVMYGDVIWDRTQKTTIFSGETTLFHLCSYLKKRGFVVARTLQLTDVDGVYDNNQKVIPQITTKNWPTVQSYMHDGSVIDVTGGMKHKIENALLLSRLGITTTITNGNNTAYIKRFIRGKAVGTQIF